MRANQSGRAKVQKGNKEIPAILTAMPTVVVSNKIREYFTPLFDQHVHADIHCALVGCMRIIPNRCARRAQDLIHHHLLY